MNQQRVLLEHQCLELHAFGIGGRGDANAIRVGLGEQLAALEFGLAVDDLGGRGSLCVFQRGLLARFGLKPALLDLFLLERQRVLHGVGFALGLQHACLRPGLCLLHVADLLRLGLELGDAHLFLLDLGLEAQSLILLFLQQQSFQALGVFSGQHDVAHHDFFHHDAVGGQARGDRVGGALPKFLAARGEDLAHDVVRRCLAKDSGHHRRDDLLFERLRQIGVNRVQALGFQPPAHRDSHTDREAFAAGHSEEFSFFLGILCGDGGEDVVAHVVLGHVLNERENEMHAGIERTRTHARNLADAHARRAVRHNDNAQAQQQGQPRQPG